MDSGIHSQNLESNSGFKRKRRDSEESEDISVGSNFRTMGDSKKLFEELNEIFMDCDVNCATCVKFIFGLNQHIRAAHSQQTTTDWNGTEDVHFKNEEEFTATNISDVDDEEEELKPNLPASGTEETLIDSHNDLEPLTDPLHIDHDLPHQSSSVQVKCEVEEDVVQTEMSEFRLDSECDPGLDDNPSTPLIRPEGHQIVVQSGITSFDQRSLRLTEPKNIHAGVKEFKCDVCERSFTKPYRLTEHKKTHTGEKPYQCNVCEMSFSLKVRLSVHMRRHTGEKPYQCDVCGKRFSQNVRLSAHMKSHTGERPYQCDVCGISFSLKVRLTAHMRIHAEEKPYQCDVCGNSFRHETTLSVHKRIHTGEKPFQCEECGMSFTQSHHLTDHKACHTGEKRFICDVCNKGFRRPYHLNRHKRVHTAGNP